ncbi:MAG: hypothetical protein ABI042_14560 [Verrucomicrobiota bacterium]
MEIIFKHAECLTNDYAIAEARRNLELKFPTQVRELDSIIKNCEVVRVLVGELEVELKSKDVPILKGAIVGKATHLLTGDERDFGKFYGKTIQGVTIISPRMLADEFVKRGWL